MRIWKYARFIKSFRTTMPKRNDISELLMNRVKTIFIPSPTSLSLEEMIGAW
ncbi:MAG: hypothetical protein QY310_12565 [Candidatus Jettenia sp. CY-1]|nr:MAG: hypothetical protein QY310_12565 [Candidatus Jettenia sp. CY-1]